MASFGNRWQTIRMIESCMLDIDPVDDPIYKISWELDTEMRPYFNELIASYNAGKLHSMEFFQALRNVIVTPHD
jgi:hypothetical protein